MPFDLASGMAGMSISGMSAAATPPSNVPSGLDRAPQPPTWGAPLPASAAAVPGSMPAPTWGNAAKQAGFNPASPYTNYYAFNPLGDSGVYGSSDAQSFDPYRRDSAYGSGVTSPMDLGMLGGNVHNRRPGPGWQMGDRSPTRSPTSSFNMSAAGRGAASGAYRPDLMYSGGGGNPQLQQSLYNTPPNMPGQRVMGYQTQGRLNASGYPDQLDYSAFGATPYGGGNMPSYGADAYRAMPGASRYEDRARGMRSPLLEEFRANRHRRWDLSVCLLHLACFTFNPRFQDLRGHIVEFSGDQLGSRHLQTKLDTATVEERRM